MSKIFVLCLVLNACVTTAMGQACTTLGQTPFTAFPVCGQSTFIQKNVPLCVNRNMPSPCTDGVALQDKNPFWYKFTCFSAGTLGFMITPDNRDDDYDWQLFDVTGHDLAEVYSNRALFVACSWGHPSGPTGAAAGGTNSAFACAGANPVIMRMPTLELGHNYLLMVSHYDDSQLGYSLAFDGGTAVITDSTISKIQNAYAVCDGTEIVVKLNKKMKCGSLATDGTDFAVNGPVAISVVSASGNGCSTGFDMDSVTLKLNRILSPGTYTVTSKQGTDTNTLLDNCNNSMATGLQASLRFTSSQPTPMDSIVPVVCIKNKLQLIFSKPMKCSSIAADGSDFTVTGPVVVTVKSAGGVCTNGVSTVVEIILSSRILVNGVFQVRLKNGSDGNSLIDECDQVTPAGSTISFTTKDILTAGFTNVAVNGCLKDTLSVSHDGNNGANQWQWMIDSVPFSTAASSRYMSKAYGTHAVQLTVSNGKCSDTASVPFIFVDHSIKAAFTSSADTACATDTLHFTDMSNGNPVTWNWDLSNGQFITQQDPGMQILGVAGNRSSDRLVKLIVTNSFNCADTAYRYIYVLSNCNIAVPSAFTPNGDGLNDKLYPLNAYKASNLVFRIYSRAGQVLFESRNASRKWDGRVNGQLQPSGTYVWTLDYTDITKQQKVSLSGTTVLIR